MRRIPGLAAVGLALVGACTAGAAEPTGPPASLEGRWRLVEQRYAKGGRNLAHSENAVHLELVRGIAGVGGRIWAGDDPSQARAWPALVGQSCPSESSDAEVRCADGREVPVTIVERSFDAAAGLVSVRYEARPTEEPDFHLEIEESYRVSADGSELNGDMTVRFKRAGESRGSFVLHRRFAREP